MDRSHTHGSRRADHMLKQFKAGALAASVIPCGQHHQPERVADDGA